MKRFSFKGFILRLLQLLILVVGMFLAGYFYRLFIADIYVRKAINHSLQAYQLISHGRIVRDIITTGGRYYSDPEEWEQAIKYYHKALKNNPDFIMAHYFLGNSFNRRWNMQRTYNPAWGDKDGYARTDAERAMAEYDELRKHAPDYVEIHYELSNLYMKLGRWDESLKYLKRYIRLKPYFAKAQYKMGWLYTQKREWEKAEEWYKEALGLNDKFTMAYINTSVVYYKQKKYSLAQESYRKALEISPIHADRGIANAYRSIGEWDKALEYHKKSLEIDPLNAEIYFEMGWCYVQQEEWEEAVASYKEAIKLNENMINAYISLSNVYFVQDKKDLALEAYKKAVEINPEYVRTLMERRQ